MAQRRLVRELSPRSAALLWTLLRALPPRWASAGLGRIARALGPRLLRFRNIKKNLRAAFPEHPEAEIEQFALGVCESIGRVVGELPHLGDIGAGRRGTKWQLAGEENLAYANDGPAVFVGAHTSNWEVTAFAIARLPRPIHIVYSTVGQGVIDGLILRARKETGCDYIEKEKAVRLAMDAMRKGESVGMLVDQRVTSGVEVDFFGQPTLVTDLPARLAIRFSAAVIPTDTRRLPCGEFLVTLHPPLLPDASLPLDEQVRDLTQRMSKVIEAVIRRDPAAWFCTKRRWKQPRVTEASAGGAPPTASEA